VNFERILGNFIVGFFSGFVVATAIESRYAFALAIGNAIVQGGLAAGLELKTSSKPSNKKTVMPVVQKIPMAVLF